MSNPVAHLRFESELPQRLSLFLKQNGRCAYCGRTMVYTGVSKPNQVTVDHIYAKADGGGCGMGNIVGACFRCNTLKGRMEAHWFRHILSHFETIPEFGSKRFQMLQKAIHSMVLQSAKKVRVRLPYRREGA